MPASATFQMFDASINTKRISNLMIRRESIRFTVSNIIFHLEKSDYEMLSSYLKQAQQYYHSLPNGQKLFQDFEFNISEFLLDKLKDGGEQYVTTGHILEARAFHGPFQQPGKPHKSQTVNEVTGKNANINPFGNAISSDERFQQVLFTVLSILGLSF